MQTADAAGAAREPQVPDGTGSAPGAVVRPADAPEAAHELQVPDDLCSARETQAVVALSEDETQAARERRCSQTLEWSLLRTERLRDFRQLCRELLPAWLQLPHDRSIPRASQLRL